MEKLKLALISHKNTRKKDVSYVSCVPLKSSRFPDAVNNEVVIQGDNVKWFNFYMSSRRRF
jgi:hypothetical protein